MKTNENRKNKQDCFEPASLQDTSQCQCGNSTEQKGEKYFSLLETNRKAEGHQTTLDVTFMVMVWYS